MLSKNLITVIIASILSLATGDLVGPSDPLAPWQISYLVTAFPASREHNGDDGIIQFTITDPNNLVAGPGPDKTTVSFPPTTAMCSATYFYYDLPWNKVFNCSEVEFGYWSFEMLKPNVTSPSTNNNFDLKLTHVDSVTVASNTYTQVFEATGHFEQPENLRGYCGAGGFCSWDLLPEQVPYPVYQNRTFCQGSCP